MQALYYLASTYGSGDYNTTTYNGSSTTGSSSGSLADTGAPVALFSGLALLIIIVAVVTLIARAKKVKADKPAAKPVKPSSGGYGSGSF